MRRITTPTKNVKIGSRERNRVFVVGSMRKQELKSRKKVHASKKRRMRRSRVHRKKEPELVEYEPEVVSIAKVVKTKNNLGNVEKG